jgi:hypothetical protein
VQGANSTDWTRTAWWPLLRAQALAHYRLYGDYWSSAYAHEFLPGTYMKGSMPFALSTAGLAWGGGGFGSVPRYVGAGVGSVAFTGPYACTGLDLLYLDQVAGSFSYHLDGGAAASVSPTGVPGIRRVSLRHLTSQAHTLTCDGQGGDNVMIVQGVATYCAATGVGFGWNGISGQNAAFYTRLNTTPPNPSSLWGSQSFPGQAQLALVALGINDCQGLADPAAFGDAIRALVNGFRAGVPNASVLIVVDSNPTVGMASPFAHADQWGLYQDQMWAVARELGCALIDFHMKWGDTSVQMGYHLPNDANPSDAGHADMADTVRQMVLR